MSALTIEGGMGPNLAYEEFLEPLYNNDIPSLSRRPLVDPERAYDRLQEVWELGVMYADELSVDAIRRAMSGWSRESKDEVLQYARGGRKQLNPDTILEVEVSMKQAMLDEVAKANGGYGMDGELVDEPAVIDPEEPWSLQAVCNEVNPDVFFPPDHYRGKKKRAAERIAQQICWTCPVSVECHDTALGRPEPFGVWGGTTEKQRDSTE